MAETYSNPTHQIGQKLQDARTRQKMSLRELARKAEISASMLSQIETGKAFPSVRSLYSIAAALALPMDYFFPNSRNPASDPSNPGTPIPEQFTASEMRALDLGRDHDHNHLNFPAVLVDQLPVVHASSRPTIELKGGITWSRLTALAEPQAEFLEIHYAPGATSGTEMSHHPGREFGLVLEGNLLIELGFERHSLLAGDSLVFDSSTPHRLTNIGSGILRAVWVVLTGK